MQIDLTNLLEVIFFIFMRRRVLMLVVAMSRIFKTLK